MDKKEEIIYYLHSTLSGYLYWNKVSYDDFKDRYGEDHEVTKSVKSTIETLNDYLYKIEKEGCCPLCGKELRNQNG